MAGVTTPARPAAAASAAYSGPYAGLINSSARRNGIDPWLLAALLYVESRFNPNARSSAGAVGIAQIELSAHPSVTAAEAQNPKFAIPWAARYLASLKKSAGGATGALRAYNTGSSKPSAAGNAYATSVLNERAKLRAAVHKATGYLNPVPGGTITQLDQGIDYQGPVGGPVLAVGNGRVDAIKQDPGGFGTVIYYTLTSGPNAGQQLYVGEAQPNVRVGQVVKAGQRIATLVKHLAGANVTGPGVTETGLARGDAPLYSGGSQGGSAFKKFLGGNATSPAGGGGVLGSVGGFVGGVGHSVASPFENAYNAARGTVDAATSVGRLAGKILADPGYIVLWLGFAIVGLAFVFLGVERLLGRSASRDAGSAARLSVLAAAPEAAVAG